MAASAQSLQNSTAGLFLRIWQSTLGKKYIMAITGLGLFLFVIVHLAGNLQVYLGPDEINAYAYYLKANPAVVWTGRIGLLVIFLLHVTAASQLARISRRARPTAYAEKKVVASTFANRTILISGLVILGFVIFHLLHFTVGLVDPSLMALRDANGRHDVYRMMVIGFSNPFITIFYLVSMALLLMHLSHGVSSIFQSLGLRSNRTLGFFTKLAKISASLIFLGNCSIPLAIYGGLIK